jgi:hypothetical protein
MSDNLGFPVFLRTKDSGEVKSYRSLAEMQGDLEQIDVENGEYEAWDVAGTPLMLRVEELAWLRLEPRASPQPQQLATAIAEFARHAGVAVDTAALSRQEFATALERTREMVRANWRAKPWWRRLVERF